MAQEIVLSFLRWFHVLAGIIWLGLAYVFLFVLTPAVAASTTETRRLIVVTLYRRLLGLVRWSTLIAWLTGIAMLGMLYHAGGRMFDNAAEGWNAAAGISVTLVLLMFGIYDRLARMAFFADSRKLGLLGLLGTIAMVELMRGPAGMGYSAVLIHIGAMFGTIMTANVFMRILPVQRDAIAAANEGREFDRARLASAIVRGRHNAYLSVPLLWTMIAQHTVIPGAMSPLWFYAVLVAGWGLVALLEARTTSVPAP